MKCKLFVLLFVVVIAEDSVTEKGECKDGLCGNQEELKFLARIEHLARSRPSSNVHPRGSSVARSAPARHAPVQARRPAERHPVRQVHQAAKRHPVRRVHQAAKRHPVRQVRQRPARRHAASRSRHAQKVRRPARHPRARKPQPRRGNNNQADGGKLIGPNQIRLPGETVAMKELMLAASKAKEVSAKFSKIKGKMNEEVSKLVESEPTSKIQMKLTGFRVNISGWADKAKSVVSSMKSMIKDVKDATEEAKSVLGLINKHKNSIKGKDNFSKTISNVASDFGKHVEEGEQIEKDMESATSALSNSSNGSGIEGVVEAFKKIKAKIEAISDSLSKVANDLDNSINGTAKSDGDVPPAHEPEVSKPKESENGGKKSSSRDDQSDPIDKNSTPSVIECPGGGYLYSLPGSYSRSLTCHADEMEVLNVISNSAGTRINLQVDGKQFCTVTEDSYDPEDPEDSLNLIQCMHAKSTKQSAFERINNADGSVSFKCSNGKYLSNPKKRSLSCMADKMSETEKFKIKQPPKDNVPKEPTFAVIQCQNGGFLNSDTSFDRIVDCDMDNKENFDMTPVKQENVFPVKGYKVNLHNTDKELCGANDVFDTVKCNPETKRNSKYMKLENSDGSVSFKCSNGKYLSNPKDRNVNCKAEKITETEKFKILPAEKNPTPTDPIVTEIQCPDNTFLSGDGDDKALICGSTKKEEFNVIPVKRNSFLAKKGFKVNLQPKGKSFCTWNLRSINCYKEKAEGDYDHALFAKEDNEDGTVSFKCTNKKYLTAPGGDKLLSCSEETISDKQKFKITTTPPAAKAN